MNTNAKWGLIGLLSLFAWFAVLFFYPREEGLAIGEPIQAEQPATLYDDSYFTRYCVREGKHRFTPVSSIYPVGFAYTFTGGAIFDSSTYVFPVEYSFNDGKNLDKDYFDWNKLTGISGYLSRQNRRSAMIAWRWAVDRPFCFEVTAYTNDAHGDWRVGDGKDATAGPSEIVTVCAGQEVQFSMFEHKGLAVYTILGPEGPRLSVAHPWDRPWITAKIDPWMGGANNAEGPFGGVAPKDLTLLIQVYVR